MGGGVETMKSGTSWSIRDIDDHTRATASEAARQSGQSLSEWLNEAIERHAAEEAARGGGEPAWDTADDEELRRIAESVASLTRRIRAMDTGQRASVAGLKDRLDEIEAHLGRIDENLDRPENRATTLRGVSDMIGRLSRDLDNADESARRLVEGLRERARAVPAPMGTDPLSDAIRGLDARIQAIAGRVKGPPSGRPAKLEDLRARLDALLARAPEGAVPPPVQNRAAALDATLKTLEARIDEAKGRIAASRPADHAPHNPSAEEADRTRRIEARLAEITSRLGEPAAAPPSRREPPRPPDELAAAIAEIASRQRLIDERADAAAARRQQRAIGEAIEALRADVASLLSKVPSVARSEQDTFRELVHRIDTLVEEKPLDHSHIGELRSQLNALHDLADGAAREATLAHVGSRQSEIAERLDELLQRTPDNSRLERLTEEIATVRRAIENADSPRSISRLEMSVNELARAVEAALNSRQAAVDASVSNFAAGLDEIRRTLDEREQAAVARLEGRLDEIASRIDGLLDRTAPADVIEGLSRRLEVLAARMDQLGAGEGPSLAALAEVRGEIAAVRQESAGRVPPQVAHLEDEIRALADRLDEVAQPNADMRQLAELEAQMAHLAAELEHSTPRTVALQQIEANLSRLEGHLSDNREESLEAARLAARDAVKELTAEQIDADLVRALRNDLDSIRTASSEGDQRAQATLESLHDTLNAVVERLSQLEQETGRAAAAQQAATAATMRPGEGAAKAAAARGADNRPLEPGSGRPDLAALRELAASAEAPERRTGDRRTDFIAAARRAAQAAAQEAAQAASDEKAERPSERPGTFARIGQAIRNRRKPLLLAAAAIVLAIGALHLFGTKFSGSGPEAIAKAVPPKPPIEAVPIAPAPAAAKVAAPPKVAAAPTVPKVAEPALVAPADNGPAAIAFARPEVTDNRFGGVFDGPSADGFSNSGGNAGANGEPSAAPAPDGKSAPTLVSIGSDKLRSAAAAGDPSAALRDRQPLCRGPRRRAGPHACRRLVQPRRRRRRRRRAVSPRQPLRARPGREPRTSAPPSTGTSAPPTRAMSAPCTISPC